MQNPIGRAYQLFWAGLAAVFLGSAAVLLFQEGITWWEYGVLDTKTLGGLLAALGYTPQALHPGLAKEIVDWVLALPDSLIFMVTGVGAVFCLELIW